MKQERESQVFQTKRSSIKEKLRMLREQGIVDEETYGDFSLLALTGTAFDQLDQLSHDLAQIRQNRKQGAYRS